MAKYILLTNWTDQGIKNVKESPKRLDTAKALAENLKCKFEQFYMTIGAYDMVAVIDAPDDEAIAKFVLSLGSAGSVRTTTLKAFPEASYRQIIGSIK
jgi:uncharacterized protein with GYD domain